MSKNNSGVTAGSNTNEKRWKTKTMTGTANQKDDYTKCPDFGPDGDSRQSRRWSTGGMFESPAIPSPYPSRISIPRMFQLFAASHSAVAMNWPFCRAYILPLASIPLWHDNSSPPSSLSLSKDFLSNASPLTAREPCNAAAIQHPPSLPSRRLKVSLATIQTPLL